MMDSSASVSILLATMGCSLVVDTGDFGTNTTVPGMIEESARDSGAAGFATRRYVRFVFGGTRMIRGGATVTGGAVTAALAGLASRAFLGRAGVTTSERMARARSSLAISASI